MAGHAVEVLGSSRYVSLTTRAIGLFDRLRRRSGSRTGLEITA